MDVRFQMHWRGFLLRLSVTSVIQSSSATTVMVVCFVNAGLMTMFTNRVMAVLVGARKGAIPEFRMLAPSS